MLIHDLFDCCLGSARLLVVSCNDSDYNVDSRNDSRSDIYVNNLYPSLQDAIQDATSNDTILITASTCGIDDQLQVLEALNYSIVINASLSFVGDNRDQSIIGFSVHTADILRLVFSRDVTISFTNIVFTNVIFNVLASSNITLRFLNCTFQDTKYVSERSFSTTLSITDSKWLNTGLKYNDVTTSIWPSDLFISAYYLSVKFERVTFQQTNISIISALVANVFVDLCSFSNETMYPSDSSPRGIAGALYIYMQNTKEYSTVHVSRSIFERQNYVDPVDSIMNLYEASLRIRSNHPRVKGHPISNVSTVVSQCRFYDNERGLTLTGGFQSVIVSQCLFEENIAMHAGAAILFLLDPLLPAAQVINCSFFRNKAGAYRKNLIDKYNESFQIIGDDVRIQSKCCNGIISFVGKGGAVRVQTGNVTFSGCDFVNNTARLLGGAIFVDRGLNNLNKVTLDNTVLATYVADPNVMQGALFYSNALVTIQSAELVTTKARDHITLLSHSSDHWSIEVVNITVICPVGYKVRMTNASTYGITNSMGLKRSYMLDQLSYACESCPRHKYSLDRGYIRSRRVYDNENEKIHFVFMINGQCPDDGYSGTYEHHNIECLSCPYGGRCLDEQGITAVANFWGYQYENQVRFQHCPKGYCCTSTSCSSYDTCASNRAGRLCSRCRSGYSEAFFSSKCLPDVDCNPLWLAAFAAFSSIVYSLFLLFQRDIRELMFFHSILARGQHLKRSKKTKDSAINGRHNRIPPHFNDASASPVNGQHVVADEAKLSLLQRNKQILQSNGSRSASTDVVNAAQAATSRGPQAPSAADAGASFIIILFFYFQDVQLLHVKTVFASTEFDYIGKLKMFLTGIFKFQVEIFQFFDDMCVVPGMTPVMKVLLMIMLVPLVLLIFAVLFAAYKCVVHQQQDFYTASKNVQTNTTAVPSMKEIFLLRIATGFSLALLFTYQNLASAALTLLNCVPVNETSVLYIDGDVECYQPWQYAIMAYAVVMVLPFWTVIFFGPGLLRDCLISLPHFFCACVLPLPFLLGWLLLRLCLNGRKPVNAGQAPIEVKAVIQILQGPFKDSQTRLFGPTCGQGIVLGRRLILVLLFTFVNDSLMRMLCMNFFCFIVLLHHVHVLPYKDRRGNYAGSASAAALVIVACINLVRAAFEAAEYIPRGPYEMLVKVFDHVENLLILWLPAAFLAMVVIALTARLLCGRIIAHFVHCCTKNLRNNDTLAAKDIEMTPL